MLDLTAMTVAEVRTWLDGRLQPLSPQELVKLQQDSRSGVQQLAARYQRAQESEKAELERLAAMWQLERQAWSAGYPMVVGLDEAGCGPLAGPVVAAAVVFQSPVEIIGLNDSKKLSPAKRDELYTIVRAQAGAVGVGTVSNITVDKINILQAAKLAMRRAVNELGMSPDLALVDGTDVRLPQLGLPTRAIRTGDSRSCSIAAASIVAKVTRDRLMLELDTKYPGYGFSRHKGYPSSEHYAALRKLGPSPVHRQTFLRKFYATEADAY